MVWKEGELITEREMKDINPLKDPKDPPISSSAPSNKKKKSSVSSQSSQGNTLVRSVCQTVPADDIETSDFIAATRREFHKLDVPGPKNFLHWERIRTWLKGAKNLSYDIANHFCELAANYHSDTSHTLDYSLFPGEEERRRFISTYLGSTGNAASKEETERLLSDAEQALANRTFWGLWGIILGPVNKIELD